MSKIDNGGFMEKIDSNNIILWFFLVLFIISFGLICTLFWPFISILILASVVTGIFNPVYRFILTKKIKPPYASLLTCGLIFLILFVPIAFFVSVLSKEAYDLYLTGKNAVMDDQIKNILVNSKVLEKINLILARFDIQLKTEEFIKPIGEIGKFIGLLLFDQASAIASNAFKFFVNFFFMLLIIYYFLIDGNRLIKFIIDLSPLPFEQSQQLIQKFKDMAGAILIGNGLGGIIQGIIGGSLFGLFNLKSPFLWGVIMALLAFLPIVGIGVILIPTAIFLFLKSRIMEGVIIIVLYIIVSGGIEYIFKPKLVGSRVKMHTLLVFLAIIGGLKLFGILGIIYGPLVVTCFLTLTDIYHSSYQKMVEPRD